MTTMTGVERAGVEITEAGRYELDEVRQVLAAANEGYRQVLSPASFDAYLAMVLDLEPRFDVADVLVVRDAGRLVATVTYFADATLEGWGFQEGVSGIRSMGVLPEARGRGIAERLLDECVARSRGVGASAIGLHTAAWLPGAIRVYERYGFVRDAGLDVRASDVMPLAPEDDYVGLAYRLDL